MNDYLTNLLGAFATTLSTRIEDEIGELGGRNLNHEAALVAIRNHPNDSIDVLSKVLGITHSGAVRLINALEEDGWVERHRSKEDARAIVLRVTAKGRKRADKVLQARKQITSKVLASITTEQQQALVPVLEAILGGLTDNQEDARRICRLCNERVCRVQGCPVESAITDLKNP